MHHDFEVVYAIAGRPICRDGNRTFRLEEGALLLHGGAEPLLSPEERGGEVLRLRFGPDAVGGLLRTDGDGGFDALAGLRGETVSVGLRGSERRFVEALLRKIVSENERKLPGHREYRALLLFELLIYLQRLKGSGDWERPPGAASRSSPSLLPRVVRFVDRHYDRRLTLEELSARFYLSPSHLSRAFRESTGLTFVCYLNRLRIGEAQALLENTSCSVSEIAERVGFGNLTHFGRTFKNATGFSPLQYRKKTTERLRAP